MIVLFSRNDKIGSRLISWGTKHEGEKIKETPSHLSLLFFSSLMLESVLGEGVRLNYLRTFHKKNQILAAFQWKKGSVSEDYIPFKKVARLYHGQKYDWMGILWYSFAVLRHKIFKTGISKKNRWEKADKKFCTECLEPFVGKEISTLDPNSLVDFLRKHPDFSEIDVSSLKD